MAPCKKNTQKPTKGESDSSPKKAAVTKKPAATARAKKAPLPTARVTRSQLDEKTVLVRQGQQRGEVEVVPATIKAAPVNKPAPQAPAKQADRVKQGRVEKPKAKPKAASKKAKQPSRSQSRGASARMHDLPVKRERSPSPMPRSGSQGPLPKTPTPPRRSPARPTVGVPPGQRAVSLPTKGPDAPSATAHLPRGTSPFKSRSKTPEKTQTVNTGTSPFKLRSKTPEKPQTVERGISPFFPRTKTPEKAKGDDKGTSPHRSKSRSPGKATAVGNGSDPPHVRGKTSGKIDRATSPQKAESLSPNGKDDVNGGRRRITRSMDKDVGDDLTKDPNSCDGESDNDDDPGSDPEDPLYDSVTQQPDWRRVIPRHRKRAPWEHSDRRIWKTGPDHGSHYPLAWNGWQDDTTYDVPVGMENQKNQCYRIALLQCLFHIPAFYNMLLFKHLRCKQPICLVCATQNLMIAYWHSQPRPRSFRIREPKNDEVPTGANAFGFFQQAAQAEIATRDERIIHEYAIGQPADPEAFLQEILMACIVPGDLPGHSTQDMFRILIRHTWTCRRCKTTEVDPELDQATSISLPIGDHPTTENIIWRFEAWSANGNSRICPTCERTITSVQQMESFPDILVINLPIIGRWSPKSRQMLKVVDEEGLAVRTDFAGEMVLPVSILRAPEGHRYVCYRLHGVVQHISDTADNGHYVAGVRARVGTGYYSIDNGTVTGPSCNFIGVMNNNLTPLQVRVDAKTLFYLRVHPV